MLLPLAVGLSIGLPLAVAAGRLGERFGWVDVPDDRKRHGSPVAVTGGWAVALSTIVALTPVGAAVPVGVIAGAAIVFAVGWADDLRPSGLPIAARLLVQTFAAAVATIDPSLATWSASVIWVMVLMNAVNMIDGIDRLAAGAAALALASVGVVGLAWGVDPAPAFAFVGALLALVVVTRWGRRRIFLGDSGSLLVGYVLGLSTLTVAAQSPTTVGAVAALLIAGGFVAELVANVARRVRARRAPWRGDRDHLHHRISRVHGEPEALRMGLWIAAYFACAGVAAAWVPPVWTGVVTAVSLVVAVVVVGDVYRR